MGGALSADALNRVGGQPGTPKAYSGDPSLLLWLPASAGKMRGVPAEGCGSGAYQNSRVERKVGCGQAASLRSVPGSGDGEAGSCRPCSPPPPWYSWWGPDAAEQSTAEGIPTGWEDCMVRVSERVWTPGRNCSCLAGLTLVSSRGRDGIEYSCPSQGGLNWMLRRGPTLSMAPPWWARQRL